MTDPYETQRKKVLDWLKDGQTLTGYQAAQYWNIMRLAAIIHKLIHVYGFDIESNLEFEGSRHWSIYSMKKQKP